MNYGMPGKLKSENKWFSIEEFAAFRPKQYSCVTEDDEMNRTFKKQGILMRRKGLSTSSLIRYITHEMYVDQILKDQEAISCKMSNIQSKNFRMYTQYIYKRALVNYENKRYWLDSIYNLPFRHPWIEKIERGIMKIEEAVSRTMGGDEYNCNLSVHNILKEKEEEKQRIIEIKESYRQKVVKDENITISGLWFDQLDKVTVGERIKEEVKTIASSMAGRRLLEKYLSRVRWNNSYYLFFFFRVKSKKGEEHVHLFNKRCESLIYMEKFISKDEKIAELQYGSIERVLDLIISSYLVDAKHFSPFSTILNLTP